MGVRSKWLFSWWLIPFAGLGAACELSSEPPPGEASSSSSSAADGGRGEARDAGATETDAATGGDVDAAVDGASDDAGETSVAAPTSCSVGPVGASAPPLTVSWTSIAPTSALGRAPTVLGQLARSGCTILLESLETGGTPPTYELYLEKHETTAGNCADPKGYAWLWATYATPHGFLAQSPVDPALFAIAYDHKNSESGSSPVQLSMEQRDFVTGDVLHAAVLAVTGSQELLPPPGSPTALTASGCDVTLEGVGPFPGATGTDTGAPYVASYPGFLAPEPQDPSYATAASY